jgi:hypothetical protein
MRFVIAFALSALIFASSGCAVEAEAGRGRRYRGGGGYHHHH